MQAPIVVREAVEDDRETLLRFHRGLYETHRDEVVDARVRELIDYQDYACVLEDDMGALIADPNGYILIAESEGKPVGYITGRTMHEPRRVLPRRGVVEDWYVHPKHRRRGIGAALLKQMEEHFRSAGCQVIESATWSSNEAARRVHNAKGFQEVRVIYRRRL
jgi:ribosomal protein S18 acetylase RimI-like enzyme